MWDELSVLSQVCTSQVALTLLPHSSLGVFWPVVTSSGLLARDAANQWPLTSDQWSVIIAFRTMRLSARGKWAESVPERALQCSAAMVGTDTVSLHRESISDWHRCAYQTKYWSLNRTQSVFASVWLHSHPVGRSRIKIALIAIQSPTYSIAWVPDQCCPPPSAPTVCGRHRQHRHNRHHFPKHRNPSQSLSINN